MLKLTGPNKSGIGGRSLLTRKSILLTCPAKASSNFSSKTLAKRSIKAQGLLVNVYSIRETSAA